MVILAHVSITRAITSPSHSHLQPINYLFCLSCCGIFLLCHGNRQCQDATYVELDLHQLTSNGLHGPQLWHS